MTELTAVPTTGPALGDARPLRLRSRDPAAYGIPGGREEEWRFTPLRRIRDLLEELPGVDGRRAQLTWSTDLPRGVEVDPVEADDPLLAAVPAPVDRVSALALAHADGAVVLRVPAGAAIDDPVVLRLHGESADQPVWGHVIVDVGSQAQVTVVIEHSGSARYAAQLSVLVGDGAGLRLVGVQSWDDDAVHVGHQAVRVGRDARVHSAQVSLGGDLVRLTETVEFAGPGGDVEMSGLAFADAGQHLEHRLFVDHAASHCRSRMTYKAAVQGDNAHTVWIGDVAIRADTVGTDSYELNRNLLLTDGARADSVPNLEIETGEVTGAGHASATGRFDDQQLFYLRSRGIPTDVARRMVVRAFFADIVRRIEVPELAERLTGAIDAELERTGQ